MKQPTKDVLREQLALAADEIIRLREQLPASRQIVEADEPPLWIWPLRVAAFLLGWAIGGWLW